jgi:hypothetical protein
MRFNGLISLEGTINFDLGWRALALSEKLFSCLMIL